MFSPANRLCLTTCATSATFDYATNHASQLSQELLRLQFSNRTNYLAFFMVCLYLHCHIRGISATRYVRYIADIWSSVLLLSILGIAEFRKEYKLGSHSGLPSNSFHRCTIHGSWLLGMHFSL